MTALSLLLSLLGQSLVDLLLITVKRAGNTSTGEALLPNSSPWYPYIFGTILQRYIKMLKFGLIVADFNSIPKASNGRTVSEVWIISGLCLSYLVFVWHWLVRDFSLLLNLASN